MQKDKRLLDVLRDKIRVKHYIKYPGQMGKSEIEQYFTYMAVERNVSPTTQNQAFNALLFLYKEVLEIDISD